MDKITTETLKQYQELHDRMWKAVYAIFQSTVLQCDRYAKMEGFDVSDNGENIVLTYKDFELDEYSFTFPTDWFFKKTEEIAEEYEKMCENGYCFD